MKEVSGEYTTGHHGTKKGTGHVCKWFDDEFNTGASDAAILERQKTATNARKAAQKNLRKRAKRAKEARETS